MLYHRRVYVGFKDANQSYAIIVYATAVEMHVPGIDPCADGTKSNRMIMIYHLVLRCC